MTLRRMMFRKQNSQSSRIESSLERRTSMGHKTLERKNSRVDFDDFARLSAKMSPRAGALIRPTIQRTRSDLKLSHLEGGGSSMN